ncbi:MULTISPECIES: alkaline phosphatase family protein [unclassified Dyella]|uniref:alkaline phosphatase family protein n=1 Tax=unclassified Dyella TaxID=2634549 RepID=UPI000CC61F87|nr:MULTISPECIES: alkaline phosphatase family protein [unclassified Dyella]MDR3444065.1 alkaline phosphatase family protein [Dyella sp.]PMQ06325.1 Non-hemolytic phospholipase C [Dyella sp. AD56]
MSMTHVRKRLLPLAIGTLAVGLAGVVSAQSNPTEQNAAAATQAPATGVTVLHTPGGDHDDRSDRTRTPIKHVILLIGENRTFDHVFATYTPPKGQSVHNLLSEGIVNADGTPGPNVAVAKQWQASNTGKYSVAPTHTTAFTSLPQMNTGGAPTQAPFASAAQAQAIEPALPTSDYSELAAGGTGLPNDTIDTRFPSVLANAPVDMHASISYDDYANSPVHRFFQMWQQLDCDTNVATEKNPSGCRMDLFPWVETTVGAGTNGKTQPAGFDDESTGEGSTAMQFLNIAKGDVPYFAELARTYALSDNFHQSVMGGTGANHIMLGFGEPIYYADANGEPATPPSNQIENPDAQSGTNNWYVQDGYGGGSYVNCADDTQPGVGAVKDYLKSLPYHTFHGTDCKKNAYYLVNNYNPGYLGDGTPAPLGATQFTIPPTRQDNLALLLSRHHVSWKYYGEGYADGKESGEAGTFCNICDPFLYSTQVMTNPKLRANNQDITDLYNDIQNDTLPAVSIAKPDGILDGHPASSKLELFEGYVKKIVDMAKANPKVWNDTVIMVTFDEGGGYYDSGYIQPVDFFGDGTRIPLLVVSRFSEGGRVVHTYYDHVSFDKFVEANWGLRETISGRSRDNLPNPVALPNNPYVPLNAPAIGNLMNMFDFDRDRHGHSYAAAETQD